MGDFFLTHNEEGREYLRRIFYVNVLFYIMMGLAAVVFMVDFVFLLMLAGLVAVSSLLYAAYFVLKNPPQEYDAEISDL
ncbi:MAG: hypothetical protein ACFFCP_10265 [Promethearchaeota archaeon]